MRPTDPASPQVLRYSSRDLYHKTALAFDFACNIKDFETAESLVDILQTIAERPVDGETESERRRDREALAAARQRLRMSRPLREGLRDEQSGGC